ncbi:hypothetical protein Egran_06346 [Elaphomyces granulatus]|uniref:BZIP domain-containing protein n=1 Tax=Elaphomyces granulatus TaxID=519963 RepID=A0A232LP10_9EURO|nr:hypothetical protein Egran_06346 [Elaphomyces granulatus]
MDTLMSSLDSMPSTPGLDSPQLTISPADTSLDLLDETLEDVKSEEKKPTKKRKSWGQELPTPKTNLPPRKRAKTEDEKEQRRIERVLRNRAAAQTSRERKRLEVEKLEGEKFRVEQQNQFLLQRLTQMEAENNRLNRQVAQLSAEIHGSRGSSPKSVCSAMASPTLTPTLFKQEQDDISLDRIPFPTPSMTDYSPSLKPTDLAESSDLTQHPAAVLCDLQCQSKDSKDLVRCSPSLTPKAMSHTLQMTLQLLYLTTISAAYSTVIHPLALIILSLKMGSRLAFSKEEIYQHFHLIHWLISTPSLSSSTTSTRRSVFRMKLLSRLLACTPALARPLRDATGKALQLAVREGSLPQTGSTVANETGSQNWESLVTLVWAIDSIERSRRLQAGQGTAKTNDRVKKSTRIARSLGGSWSLLSNKERGSALSGKPF